MNSNDPRTARVPLHRIVVQTRTGPTSCRTFAAAAAVLRALAHEQHAAGRAPTPVTVSWQDGVTQSCLVDAAEPDIAAHLIAVNAQLRDQAIQRRDAYEEAGAGKGAEQQRRDAAAAAAFLATYQLEDDVPS